MGGLDLHWDQYSVCTYTNCTVAYSMQLVSACIASVAKGDAKLIGLGALGFPILMEAHMC